MFMRIRRFEKNWKVWGCSLELTMSYVWGEMLVELGYKKIKRMKKNCRLSHKKRSTRKKLEKTRAKKSKIWFPKKK